MKIDDNYSIETDSHNWMLNFQEERTNKEGKKYTATDKWYFPNLKECLRKYMDESLKPSKTMQELVAKMNQLNYVIDNLKL